jgi:hypothetical protein
MPNGYVVEGPYVIANFYSNSKLTNVLSRYARMDTHFLLYIYDRVRGLLLSKGSKLRGKRKDGGGGESSDDQEGPRTDLVQQVRRPQNTYDIQQSAMCCCVKQTLGQPIGRS